MKKLYQYLFSFILFSVLGALFLISSPVAHATGEDFEFSGTGGNSGGLGGTSITASGGAFKGDTVFTKTDVPQDGNKFSGYTVYYVANSFNLRDKASVLPGCLTTKAYIALKTSATSDGLLYPDQASQNCTGIGVNLSNLSAADPKYDLSADIRIAPNKTAVISGGYAQALSGPLAPVKAAFYTSLGSKAPCSSQGCNDTTWNLWVGDCWASARSSAADTARYQNQGIASGGEPYDMQQGIQNYFAECLAKHTSPGVTADDIKEYFKEHPVDYAAVNKAGTDAGDAAMAGFDSANDGDNDGKTSCSVGGIGWIVCPVITFLSGLADSMFAVLADTFLKVGVNILDQGGVVNNAWKAMQGLANVVLIIIFLIIVISQVSNVGVSSYGVKKLAPRLVIGAVLINMSFIICSLAVDLSNVFGYSIRDFFDGLATSAVAGSSLDSTSVLSGQVTDQNNVWAGVTGGILAVAGTAVAGYFMLSMLGTLLISALIALVVILLILVARQAIIILAIVLAPVAIALWLLPNTEKIAKQWWKIFVSMLMVFPIIALLFGGATLVSVVMTYAFGDIEGVDKDNSNWLGQITAAGVQVIPLIATPFILKGILNSVPAIGSFASRIANRATGNLGKKAADSYQRSTFATARADRLQARRTYQANKVAEKIRDNKGATGLFTRGLNFTEAQKYANRSVARTALAAADEGDSKDVNAEQNALIAQRIPIDDASFEGGDLKKRLQDAVRAGDSVQTRAIQNILLKSGEKGRVAFHEAMGAIEGDSTIKSEAKSSGYETMRRNIKYNHSDIKSVDAAIDKFSNDQSGSLQSARESFNFDSLSDAQLAGQHEDNVREAVGLANDPARAQRMLDNPTLSGMSVGVRNYLQEIVNAHADVSNRNP